MKIVVDATALLVRSAGVKSVLYHWIRALTETAGESSVGLYPPLSALGGLDHERSVASRWETVRGLTLTMADLHLRLPVADWVCGPADIFHCSNQVKHPPERMRWTATVHDLTCWKMPEFHTAANVEADKRYAERVLCRAHGLIAVSESTRRDAIEVLKVHPGRIRTIPNGVAECYFDAEPRRAKKPYVLALGTIEPRKNVDRLLDAWGGLRRELRERYELVVAGPLGWAQEATAARLKAGEGGVRWLGYVPEAELPGLVAGATLLAYPSLYEGFGLPLAQAMASGVPLVTSNVSSMPEVAGEAARLVDPRSVEEIRAAIAGLLERPEERARRGRAGREKAEAYRWAAVARESWKFFEEVLGR